MGLRDIAKGFVALSDSEVSEGDVVKLLDDNDFCQTWDNPRNGTMDFIEKESRRFSLSLPERYITMSYYLGDEDFDEAQLFLPDYDKMIRNLDARLTLDTVRAVSEGMSRLVIGVPLIEFCARDKFDLPRFRLYRDGAVERKSASAGERPYSANFREEDRKAELARAKRSARRSVEGFDVAAKLVVERRNRELGL